MRRRNTYSNFGIFAPAVVYYGSQYYSQNEEPEVEVSSNIEEEINSMNNPANVDLGVMTNVPDDVTTEEKPNSLGYTGGLIDNTEANKKKKRTIIIVSASIFLLGGILLYVVNR
jgi:hypothetical protein